MATPTLVVQMTSLDIPLFGLAMRLRAKSTAPLAVLVSEAWCSVVTENDSSPANSMIYDLVSIPRMQPADPSATMETGRRLFVG